MPSTRPGGPASPVLLILYAVLMATVLPNASAAASDEGGRSGQARGAGHGLTAIAASVGSDVTASTLSCTSSFGPSLGASDSSLQGVALAPRGAWGVGFELLRHNLRRPVIVRSTASGLVGVQRCLPHPRRPCYLRCSPHADMLPRMHAHADRQADVNMKAR